MHVPWWAYVLVFTPMAAFGVLIGVLSGGGPVWKFVAFSGSLGMLMVVLVWWGTALRKVRLDKEYLALGYGDKIEVGLMDSVEVIKGWRRAQAARRAVRDQPDRFAAAPGKLRATATPLLLLGKLGFGLGQVALGASAINSALAKQLAAMRNIGVTPWSTSALVITTPAPGTQVWLVGSIRDPEDLAGCLRQTIDEVRAERRRQGITEVEADLAANLDRGWAPPGSADAIEAESDVAALERLRQAE